MGDLMDLVKSCAALDSAKQPNYAAIDLAGELGKLGFDKMARKVGRDFIVSEKMECITQEKYPVITEEKIQAFLNGLAKDYNAKRKKNTITLNGQSLSYVLHPQTPLGLLAAQISFTNNVDWDTPQSDKLLTATTCDAMSSDPGTVGAYRWIETKISDYDAIPPDHALKALKKAQELEIFDYYTVGTVSAIKDPLLLGRIEGVEERYFLAQWGEDVCLDDLI